MNIQSPNLLSNRPTSVENSSPGLFHCRVLIPSIIKCRLKAMFIVKDEKEQLVNGTLFINTRKSTSAPWSQLRSVHCLRSPPFNKDIFVVIFNGVV
jgi:hypothetical protein